MHPDMLTPKFNVGDKVWYIVKDDDIGKAVLGTVIKAEPGCYVVKCDGRDDCGNGHYRTPYELFRTAEAAYASEIISCETSIECSEESIKDEKKNIDKKRHALMILKERKEQLEKLVWVTDCGEVKCVRAGDEKYRHFIHYRTQEEAWRALSDLYKEKFEKACHHSSVTRYVVIDTDIIFLSDCEEGTSIDRAVWETEKPVIKGTDFNGRRLSFVIEPNVKVCFCRMDAEIEVRRRREKLGK